jgi:NADH-quinone oxidoreductase subunit H
LPRLRIDQVMTTCLKYLVPISCFLFLGATVWPLVIVKATGGHTTLVGQPIGTRISTADARERAERVRNPMAAPMTRPAGGGGK